MSKIKNRFAPKQLITIHDELLSNLYALSVNNIRYKVINGESYLVNSIKDDHFEIGLRVKIRDNDLPKKVKDGDYLAELIEDTKLFPDSWERSMIAMTLKIHYQELCFSNIEKFLTNVLFEKFLSYRQEFNITFLEIEHKYRGKASYRAKSLSSKVAERYANTLDSLCRKELFLITDDKFRACKYGARNKCIYQQFLTITDKYKYGINNITFSYTFSGFGTVIKNSRRYSNIMPRSSYHVSFNEIRWHLAAFYLAQQIFINLGINKQEFEIDLDGLIDATEDLKDPYKAGKPILNRLRIKRRLVEKIEAILDCILEVQDYRINYTYDETERFEKKYEGEYDTHYSLDNYEFGVKDLGQDVNVTITVILDIY